MFNKRKAAVISVTLLWFVGGVGATDDPVANQPAQSQMARSDPGDMRKEDRREDRREDHRHDGGVQAALSLPRGVDGSVDIAALLAAVDARFDAGAREIQIRGASLTQQEMRDLLLVPGRDENLLRQIADLMPAGTGESTVRLHGVADARVQRKADGSLRLRVDDINFSNMSAAQRAELARRLAQESGFDRVRFQGTDADGKRVRTEFRTDKGLVANVAPGSGRSARPQDGAPSRQGIGQELEGSQAANRADRPEKGQDDGRGDRVASTENRPQRPDRSERAERPDKLERQETVERPERLERPEKLERAERIERPEKAEHPERVEMVQKVDRPDRSNSGKGR